MSVKLTEADLRQFTGTEQYYRHSLARKILYTDGVQYLAEKAGAYWLVDKIAIMQIDPKIRAEEFQVWRMIVKDGSAILTCDTGEELPSIYREEIAFTDFPLEKIDIWVEGGVILLPSEH